MAKTILLLAIAHALGTRRASQKQIIQAVVTGRTVMCAKHKGNGLLLWSDGQVGCYTGGPGN